jgi:hypothetical protein
MLPNGGTDAARSTAASGRTTCDSPSSAFLLVALLSAGGVLLLLTGLRLPALLLLPRPRLTAALLLTGLLVASLRRLRSLVRSLIRIIHLSTSFG